MKIYIRRFAHRLSRKPFANQLYIYMYKLQQSKLILFFDYVTRACITINELHNKTVTGREFVANFNCILYCTR